VGPGLELDSAGVPCRAVEDGSPPARDHYAVAAARPDALASRPGRR
jgi:hypothetical protein